MRILITALTCSLLWAATFGTGVGVAGAQGQAPTSRDYEALWDAATQAERNAAGDLIVETGDAAARWADVDAALVDGFAPNRPGNGAIHYRNVGNRRDGRVLDAERPEALVYLHAPEAEPVLLGVVYVTLGTQERPVPAGDLAAWHVHHAPGCHHPDVDAGCEDVRGGMLHVWLYAGVVDPFADPMFASMGSRPAWRAKLGELAALS
jgi:hypothetical protein